jgi:aryl-alcohol dehydrogenase-like predicted oxidoreductase
MIERFLEDDLLTRVQQLQPIADELGLTMTRLAVAWVFQHDDVASAIVGASRPEQVAENVKASGVMLDPDVMRRIDEIVDPVIDRDPAKTQTQACQPRPEGFR